MNEPLFAPEYAEPVDVTTCVERIPGTADAPCLCRAEPCHWPWCVPPDRYPHKEDA